MVAERERIAEYLEAEPDKTFAFIAEMGMGTPEGEVIYTCPMHPEVVMDEPGHCPECGMKLLPEQLVAEAAAGHEDVHDGHDHADAGGIEWEADMLEVNRLTPILREPYGAGPCFR
jgi:Heavy metal binding domain